MSKHGAIWASDWHLYYKTRDDKWCSAYDNCGFPVSLKSKNTFTQIYKTRSSKYPNLMFLRTGMCLLQQYNMRQAFTWAKRVEVLNSVTQTTSGMGNGDSSISHCKKLVKPTRLKSGGHENGITACYNLVGHVVWEAHPSPANLSSLYKKATFKSQQHESVSLDHCMWVLNSKLSSSS